MFIDRFYFLSKENELDAILAGVTYSGGKKYKEGALPFRVLPQRGIEILYLTGVTVITGSSDSPKAMMMKVMAAKLGVGKEKNADEYAGVGTPLGLILWAIFAAVCYFIMPAYAKARRVHP